MSGTLTQFKQRNENILISNEPIKQINQNYFYAANQYITHHVRDLFPVDDTTRTGP
jgi:hypothetical protein